MALQYCCWILTCRMEDLQWDLSCGGRSFSRGAHPYAANALTLLKHQSRVDTVAPEHAQCSPLSSAIPKSCGDLVGGDDSEVELLSSSFQQPSLLCEHSLSLWDVILSHLYPCQHRNRVNNNQGHAAFFQLCAQVLQHPHQCATCEHTQSEDNQYTQVHDTAVYMGCNHLQQLPC